MFVSKTRIRVRYAETDRMGIVHHSSYAVWFEEARTDYFNQLGHSYARVEEQGIYLPLTDLACSFKKPAQYEQDVIVETRITRATCVRLQFSYTVTAAEDGALIATGQTDHAWTDKTLQPISIMRRMPEVYELLCTCMREG